MSAVKEGVRGLYSQRMDWGALTLDRFWKEPKFRKSKN